MRRHYKGEIMGTWMSKNGQKIVRIYCEYLHIGEKLVCSLIGEADSVVAAPKLQLKRVLWLSAFQYTAKKIVRPSLTN